MSPGGDWAFFPAAARGRLSFVGTQADINLWSIAIDAGTGTTHGPLRRLTRGAGFISHLTLSDDGRSLAYCAARTSGGELHVRDLESGSDTVIGTNAERGFPVSDIIAAQWSRAEEKLRLTPESARDLLLDGHSPRHGEVIRFPKLSRTLRQIAEGGRDAFYKGEIAEQIVEFSNKHDGMLTLDDFAAFDAQWIEPVSTHYHGVDVHELGAQTQGITALEMLNILEGFDLKAVGHNSPEYLHLMVEAKKLAFADRDAYIADPDKVRVPAARLISKEYAAERRKLISRTQAMASPRPGLQENGDTVYLTVVDRDRNAVSFINSLFESFGSGLVAGDTGVVLHLSDDDRLEVFSSAKDSMRISVLEDEALQDDLKLFHTGKQALMAKGRKLYKFKLQT